MAIAAAAALLVAGCALPARSANTAAEPEPDCSFESATTCWTMVGRFLSRRPPARDTLGPDFLAPPPATLVVRTDSDVSPP
jgi:hypothetical protein